MRFVICLGKQIKFDVLKKALRLSIYAEPIFSYFYKEEIGKAYWQKQEEINSSILIDLIESKTNLDNEISHFLTLEIKPFDFPIVRVRVIRKDQKDVICVNMNHTPTDGSGLKLFVRILASTYSNLINNPEYEVKANLDGERGIKQVTDYFTFFQKLKFLKEGFKAPKRLPSWSFCWNKSDVDNQKYFITSKIMPETFHRIKAYGKMNNATINDVVLAAFIRSFVSTNNKNSNAVKPIIVPVDLRKYVSSTHNTSICSLTSSLICNIGWDIGKTFDDTLIKVREEINFKKQMHAEMNMLAPALVLSKFLPYEKLKKQFMNRKMPPIPLVTNVGIINPSDINFDNIPIEHSFITGAISLGDFFCMGYSTFQEEITFSIGFIGGVIQIQKVNDFLTSFKTELENIE
jgi:NRPS condensation-like uncharacterized protein